MESVVRLEKMVMFMVMAAGVVLFQFFFWVGIQLRIKERGRSRQVPWQFLHGRGEQLAKGWAMVGYRRAESS